MIIGVTYDNDGRVVQRLSVSTKVSIGLPPNGDRNHPTKLDHFVFLRKKKTANRVEWEIDPELTKHYGEQFRDLHIMFIDDDIENVFSTSYAWWTATERKCWGDGTLGTRPTAEKPGGQPWKPCGNGCPELYAGQCKPGGDLRFVLADFPRLGSVCRIHTCSYRSIHQIHSALQEIQTFTAGRLARITAKLKVRPEGEAMYFDRKEKRKRTASIWALSLEVEGDDMQKLIANLTENARLFADPPSPFTPHFPPFSTQITRLPVQKGSQQVNAPLENLRRQDAPASSLLSRRVRRDFPALCRLRRPRACLRGRS